MYLGSVDMLREPVERLLHTDPEPDAISLLAAAFFSVINAILVTPDRGRAEPYLRRLEQVIAGVIDHDPITLAWVELARSMWHFQAERDFWSCLEHARRAVLHYERSGAGGVCPFGPVFIALCYSYLGLFDRAEEEFSRTLATVTATGPEALTVALGRSAMRIDQRRLEEASALASWVVQEGGTGGETRFSATGALYLVEAHLYEGAIEAAELGALALNGYAATDAWYGMWYLAVLACIRLAQGRAGEAREISERALSRARSSGIGHAIRHGMLLLVHAEALHALGDHDAACQTIREAREDLRRRAAKIPDPEVRRSFLDNIPDHRRTLELARLWLGEE